MLTVSYEGGVDEQAFLCPLFAFVAPLQSRLETRTVKKR